MKNAKLMYRIFQCFINYVHTCIQQSKKTINIPRKI